MRIMCMIALSCLLALPSQAACVGAGCPEAPGVAGPGLVKSTTVKALKSRKDNSFVTLTGRIVSRIGGGKYVFQDSTGQITVDIDDDDFRGQTVSTETTVRITGEVDRDFGRASEIDVKTLEVVNQDSSR